MGRDDEEVMRKPRYFAFEPFWFDVLDERLWKRDASVPIGHKALAVLQHLVDHPDQLVTKDELLAAVWPDTAVSEAVLTTAMREIRSALGDEARAPRFVQTVHGRGYRFIAPVAEAIQRPDAGGSATHAATPGHQRPAVPPIDPSVVIVGRDREWVRLREWYESVRQGTRRIGFIAGEAGIGKTALVDAFVAEIAAGSAVRVGHGQCIEQYGAGEAYLPILEALGRLGRDADVPLADVLRDHAPSWLAHLPSLAGREPPGALARVAPERMLRELAEALEVLTASDPLVLVLEDLHWSDSATLEWLGYVARRRGLARLLVLGTYRPVEALLNRHPLRRVIAELRQHPHSAELVLHYLQGDAVESYLRQRSDRVPGLENLADVLYRRTGGHPLFLAGIVDELIQQQVAAATRPDLTRSVSENGEHAPNAPPSPAEDVRNSTSHARAPRLPRVRSPLPSGAPGLDLLTGAHAIPASVRQFIEHRFEQLSVQDQAILEAASVSGDAFSVAAVVAGTSLSEEEIDARCAAWTREYGLLIVGDTVGWPDGTVAAGYRFRHALYQEVAYGRISPERRVRLHQRIATRLERAHATCPSSIAAELAMHFEQGRDAGKAVTYLEQAARNALHRSAYSEAHCHLVRALGLLDSLPEGGERWRQEITLSLLLAQVLETTKGWSVEGVERAYARAAELCMQLRDDSHLLQASWGLIAVSLVRGEIRKTQAISRGVLGIAKARRDPLFRMAAHAELGGIAFSLGQPASARRHFRMADALYDPREHRACVASFGMDLGLFARSWATHLVWQQGHPDRARASAEEAMRQARALGHPFTRTITLAYAAMLSQFRQDVAEVDRLADATIAYATEHGFPYYLAWAEVLRGWSLTVQGAGETGIGRIRRGLDVLRSTAGLRLPYYRALLADACGRIGRVDEGLQAIVDAFGDVHRTEERWWEGELHRTRGELLQLAGHATGAEAEACFRTAIDVARRQHARSLELRATVSLGRLWRKHSKRKEARLLVATASGWFTEGFDTPDLTDARLLLEELAR